MMEGLGKATKSTKAEGKIQDLKLTPDGDALTHQQFVDDTMLQGTPTVKEALIFKQILNDFAMAAGFQRDQLPSKYLGIPLTDKPLSKAVWEPVINKLQDKIRKWTNRNIQRDFLWGKGEEKKKWALVAWEKICKHKTHGGLGLDDPETLSKVLGEKLWWRWLKELVAPWAKVWKQKYANNWQEREHIRMSGLIKGSHIWNKAGNFNLKEAKRIALGLDFPNPDKLWKDLWQNQNWMKIKLFMWLVQHKRILTWENLRK
eukprot:PITA_02127